MDKSTDWVQRHMRPRWMTPVVVRHMGYLLNLTRCLSSADTSIASRNTPSRIALHRPQ